MVTTASDHHSSTSTGELPTHQLRLLSVPDPVVRQRVDAPSAESAVNAANTASANAAATAPGIHDRKHHASIRNHLHHRPTRHHRSPYPPSPPLAIFGNASSLFVNRSGSVTETAESDPGDNPYHIHAAQHRNKRSHISSAASPYTTAHDAAPAVTALPPRAPRMAKESAPSRRAVANPARAVAARSQSVRDQAGARPAKNLGRSGTIGRQFTVGNIGHNGLIYLRPVARPAADVQRQPWQPASHFYDTTGSSKDGLLLPPVRRRNSSVDHESIISSAFSNRTPAQDVPRQRPAHDAVREGPKQVMHSHKGSKGHARSHSFSNTDERPFLTKPGTFKVVIRPATRQPAAKSIRRASIDTDTTGLYELPPLNVDIPNQPGRRALASRGNSVMRSSMFTGESDKPSIGLKQESPGMFNTPRHSSIHRSDRMAFNGTSSAEVLVPQPQSLHSAQRSLSQFAIHLFDELAYNSDDPSVVRYSPTTGEIIAATPSRLIAHITSPNFLDYELLSDFFLTFRVFLLPSDLVAFLLARLRWAVDRADDFGRIVRVRTFVALRHWILNYFPDDFAPDFVLRQQFCDTVNDLYANLRARFDGGAGDLKIIGELKKCWRRTCSAYWISEKKKYSMEDEIDPGGRIESVLWQGNADAPGQMQPGSPERPIVAEVRRSYAPSSASNKVKKSGLPSIKSTGYSTHQSTTKGDVDPPLSPSSIHSMHVISCSFPFKPIYRNEPGSVIPLFPHPVAHPISPDSNVSYPPTIQKPSDSIHEQREAGIPDGMQEDRTSNNGREESDGVPGSLVHGALYRPTSPYFEFKSIQRTPTPASGHGKTETSSPVTPVRSPGGDHHGMKRLFGSVRRALSHNLGISPHHTPGSSVHTSDSRASSNTDIHSHRHSQPISRTQTRVDLLCSLAGEQFRIAIEAEQRNDPRIMIDRPESEQPLNLDAAVLNAMSPGSGVHHPPFDRSVTVGSRSIVIVDDTNSDDPAMRSPATLEMLAASQQHLHPAMRSAHPLAHSMSSSSTSRTSRTSSIRHRLEASARNTPSVYVPQQQQKPDQAAAVYVPTGFRSNEKHLATDPELVVIKAARGAFRNSMRATSVTSTLRKYASYHSGFVATPKRETLGMEQKTAESPVSKSSDTNPLGVEEAASPVRKLRRRPGGNLKAVSKVVDLEARLARRHSVGSMSTISKSMPDSLIFPDAKQMSGRPAKEPEALARKGSVEEKTGNTRRRRSISLIQTHSSQPNLRPSFEAEVAKLRALPDDDDDGGVDATLLKLEGRYEKPTPPMLAEPLSPTQTHSPDSDRHRRHHEHVEDIHPEQVRIQSSLGAHTRSIYHMSASPLASPTFPHRRNESNAESDVPSYSSVPLLERGHSSRLRVANGSVSDASTVHARSNEGRSVRADSVASSAAEYASKAESVMMPSAEQSTPRLTAAGGSGQTTKVRKPRVPTVTSSFLLDDAQELSDNDGHESDDFDGRSFFDDEEAPEQPAAPWQNQTRKDTPPEKLLPKLNIAPSAVRQVHSSQRWELDSRPSDSQHQSAVDSEAPAVLPSPPSTFAPAPPLNPTLSLPNSEQFYRQHPFTMRKSMLALPHLPFILAYEVSHLAQQLTLLEKDALDELDWRELIDLRWNQSPPATTDWVSYLRSPDPFGVGLVIARFNLVVKWTVSEVLLTDSPTERARTIVHYIRIAAHCRGLRNFATMYQITVALLSADCARLKATWALVPPAEQDTLRDLESVVQPLHNFHNLRVEMETGPADAGCIPFIGIYTRDLVYNAQKPAVISSPPQHSAVEPLVNFERHHTSAAIVKSLLRLLEQSARYDFAPDPQCLARCLWMSALEEADIRSRSERLE